MKIWTSMSGTSYHVVKKGLIPHDKQNSANTINYSCIDVDSAYPI